MHICTVRCSFLGRGKSRSRVGAYSSPRSRHYFFTTRQGNFSTKVIYSDSLKCKLSIPIEKCGNFQVLSRFLHKVNLEIVNLESKNDPRAAAARLRTADQHAYIVNAGGHYYCIRSYGRIWYSYDSRIPNLTELPVVGPHIALFLSKDSTFTTEKFD